FGQTHPFARAAGSDHSRFGASAEALHLTARCPADSFPENPGIKGRTMRDILRARALRIAVTLSLLVVPCRVTAQASDRSNYYLNEGDRVVFYGDSITDQMLYTGFVETYTITRFPHLNVTFVHSGWGGDRVTGGGGGPIDLRLR